MTRKMKSTRVIVAIAAAASLMNGIPLVRHSSGVVHARSNSKKKTSPDLDDKIKKGPGGLVDCLISTAGAPGQSLKAIVSFGGGTLKRDYKHVNVLAAKLPPGIINAIAAQSDVNYISLDRTARVTGHLETTTGADQVRGYGSATAVAIPGSATTATDGSGIG